MSINLVEAWDKEFGYALPLEMAFLKEQQAEIDKAIEDSAGAGYEAGTQHTEAEYRDYMKRPDYEEAKNTIKGILCNKLVGDNIDVYVERILKALGIVEGMEGENEPSDAFMDYCNKNIHKKFDKMCFTTDCDKCKTEWMDAHCTLKRKEK